MVSLNDTGNDASTSAAITWEYDLNSNVVKQATTYTTLTSTGAPSSSATQTEWFAYDSMNREVIYDGTQSGSTIVAGSGGTAITYDAAGDRVTSTDSSGESAYTYDAAGQLAQVTIAGNLAATYAMDAMGRVLQQNEYNSAGTSIVYSKSATYDADSNITSDAITTVRSGSGGTLVQDDTYSYVSSDGATNLYDGANGSYQGGAVTDQQTTTALNGGTATTSNLETEYVWAGGQPDISETLYTPNTASPGTVYNTNYTYGQLGNLSVATINDGSPRQIAYVTNLAGQILSSTMQTTSGGAFTGPSSVYYFFDGVQEGEVSNNGTNNVDYTSSIAEQTATPGSGFFTDGATSGASSAQFGTTLQGINALGNQTDTSPTYTVQAGDTLQSVAQELWGNSSYWYLLADANGLSADATLSAGQILNVPQVVSSSQNNASTNTVYNASEAIGNISPTHPPAPPKNGGGCGAIGEILLAIVAVAVTVLTYGAASAAAASVLGVAEGSTEAAVVGGALGNQTDTSPTYTVQAGDTLQSVAQELWGNSSYWYLLADANGLSADATLSAGQILNVPQVVSSSQNNASTNTVYNASEAIGNISPTHPPAPPKNGGGCGAIGEILLAIVAVAVTVLTYGAASAAAASVLGVAEGSTEAAVVGGAIAGAAGSVVSQGVGLATGLQSQFNWAAVGEAAIGGAVGGGIASTGAFSGLSGEIGSFGVGALQGITGSLVSQGLDVATGLQSKFSWAGVAAAGVGAAAGAEAGTLLPPSSFNLGSSTLNSEASGFVSGIAGVIANAATRTLISGTDFGDNIIAALPDAIGQTIGNAIAGDINQPTEFEDDDGDTVQYTPPSSPPQPLTEGVMPDDTAGSAPLGPPVVVTPLAPVPGVPTENYNAAGNNDATSSGASPGVPDASAANSGDIETVVVEGHKDPNWLTVRFNAALQNARDKRQLPKEVNYTFQPNYVVAKVRTVGTTETVEQRIPFQTRAQADDFLSKNMGVVTNPDGSQESWGELLGQTTGSDQVTIYAGAVDPSPNDYTVYYPASNGKPEINVQLDPGVWQEVAINTMFHEAYHAVEEVGGDPQSGNEYNARVYSLQHMTKGGYP